MIQITPHMRILAAVEPVDFRSGIDRLCRLCRSELTADPFSGALFVFINKRRTALRILCYDGQGFWLCHKRLSSGRFRWIGAGQGAGAASLAAFELQMLLWNSDLARIEVPQPWREIHLNGRGPEPPSVALNR
jgi:transposase